MGCPIDMVPDHLIREAGETLASLEAALVRGTGVYVVDSERGLRQAALVVVEPGEGEEAAIVAWCQHHGIGQAERAEARLRAERVTL